MPRLLLSTARPCITTITATGATGRLFLIDAGAELPSGYCGDMSSTVPADKTFTPRQRAVYEIQNAMHLESVKALRPGIPYMKVYELSAQVMVEGLKELGLMKGNAEDAVREGAHALFYPHGLGHMMGLDVHDMENLGELWVAMTVSPRVRSRPKEPAPCHLWNRLCAYG